MDTMAIYNKPHVPRPMGSGSDAAGPDSMTTPTTADQVSPSSPSNSPPPSSSSSSSSSASHPRQEQEGRSPPSLKLTGILSSTNPPDKAASKSSSSAASAARQRFPFTFPPLFFQSHTSSTSIAPSTAEGKPIPLSDTTAAHRTSALQKLNSTYPSADPRHRYAKSSGAQNSTYSQPVIVRTYSGPSSSQNRHRASSTSRGLSRRVPLTSSTAGGGGLSSRLSQPELSSIGVGIGSNRADRSSSVGSSGVNMPRHHKSKKSTGGSSTKLPIPWQWIPTALYQEEGEAKLPPPDAFSFKSFMADMQTRDGDGDIGADLDRIAEICARSRYSLSNQYEVHVAPHGSGTTFATGVGSTSTSSGYRRKKGSGQAVQGGVVGGPTLQAVASDDDESSSHSRHRRRNGGRKRSAAYGTLETIMSSSRSSEEDKAKKKPAADIAGEVRGRAARKAWDTSGSGSMSASASASASAFTASGEGSHSAQIGQGSSDSRGSKAVRPAPGRLARKTSASFANAIMKGDVSSSPQYYGPSSVASALLSEPAFPQTSNSHLGVRTAPGQRNRTSGLSRSGERREVYYELPQQALDPARGGAPGFGSDGWSSWIPWRSSAGNQVDGAGHRIPVTNTSSRSHAEGSLRQLLRTPAGDASGPGAHY